MEKDILPGFHNLCKQLKKVVNLAAQYFVFENSRHFQRAIFIFQKLLPPNFFVQK